MSWVFILAYLLIQLGIGYWVSLRIQNEDDYFLAGRNLGAFAISFSLFATWFGAETCIGSAGAIYEIGLAGGRADPFGYALNFFILGFLIATPLWKGGHKTLADFFKASYGPTLEKVVVWVLLPSSVIWAAAQIKAFGEVISATSPLNVEVAVTIAAAFVIVYTFLGGLLGDIITDILQGGILLIILVITLFVTVDYLGGWATTIDLIDPQRLSLMRDDESFLEKFDRWMIPVIGAVMTQELIARVLAAKNVSVARKSSFIAGGMYLSLGAIPAFLGLIGPKVIPGIDSVESYLPMLAQTVLPQYLYILFFWSFDIGYPLNCG
jgi:SSS family solute:Na+ symporter